MNNIIRIFILIFAMSVLSGQVLAQSVSNEEINYIIKNEIWSATRTLDKQIRAAQKAGNKAEVNKLFKTKKAVLVKRKKIMATRTLDKQILANKVEYTKLIKTKKNVRAKKIKMLPVWGNTPTFDKQLYNSTFQRYKLIKTKNAVLAKRFAENNIVQGDVTNPLTFKLGLTRTIDKQILAAQKAGNKAEVIKLKKLKKTVLAKRKIIMATPELNQQINAAIANYNNIIKAKKAVLAKRKIIMATNKIDQEIDSITKLWSNDCIDQSRDSAKIIYSTLWEQQIQAKCKKLVKRQELLLKKKSSIISKRMTQYKIKPFTSGEKFSITYTSKLLTPELDKEILLVNASYKKLKKTRQKLKHKRMDENNIKSKCPFPMILVSQKCRQEG